MQKDELLQKYRSEQKDEGREYVNHSADSKGFTAMLILAVLLMVYQMYKDVPFGDVAVLLFSFLAVGGLYRYKETKEKNILLLSFVNSIICVGFIVWYVIQTF